MGIDGISQSDLQALKLLDFIAARFEADAGFPLPGIAPDQIKPELAESFGCGPINHDRMDSLVASGLLVCRPITYGKPIYSFSETGIRVLGGIAQH